MNNENANNKLSKDQELGALWLKKSKAGASYLSGYVLDENKQKVQLVVFKNNFKKPGESSPDYRIYLSEQKNNAETGGGSVGNTESSVKSSPSVASPDTVEDNGDEIPF